MSNPVSNIDGRVSHASVIHPPTDDKTASDTNGNYFVFIDWKHKQVLFDFSIENLQFFSAPSEEQCVKCEVRHRKPVYDRRI